MGFSTYVKMLFSSQAGWEEIEQNHPKVSASLLLVLPMSLYPPAMLMYAGLDYGHNYFVSASYVTWLMISIVFLIVEWVAVPLMAIAIKSTAEMRGIHTNYRDTFAVASIAALPMWLSSIALFVNSPLFIISVALLGLIASISLIYHGIIGLLHLHEEIEVAAITYTTICLGIVVWISLVALIFLPLLT